MTDDLLPDAWADPPGSERIDPTDTATWLREHQSRLLATRTDAVDPGDLLTFERTGREQTANDNHRWAKTQQDREWQYQLRMDAKLFEPLAPVVPVKPLTLDDIRDLAESFVSAITPVLESLRAAFICVGEAIVDFIGTVTQALDVPAVRLRPVLPEYTTMQSTARMRQPIPRRLDISHGHRSKHPP